MLFRRANNVYEAPRELKTGRRVSRKKRSRANGLCCGDAQMFKDAEPGNKEINVERTEDALDTSQKYCCWMSVCNTMLTDGIKNRKRR
jgi:Fe-S oxidoreductase